MEELRKEAYGELHNNPFLKISPKDEEKEKDNNSFNLLNFSFSSHQKEKENPQNPFLFNQEEKENNLNPFLSKKNPSPKKDEDDKAENNFQKKRIQKLLFFP